MSKMDYEAMQGIVTWELDKARVMLDDVSSFFAGADTGGPTATQMLMIEHGYHEIAAKLAVLGDILDNIEAVFGPVEELAG